MKIFRKIILLCLISTSISGQNETKPIVINGYLSGLQTIMFQKIDEEWTTENLFHNRLNINLYPIKNLTASAQFRTRLIYGETFKYYPGYTERIGSDDGWLDLSFNISSGKSYVLNTSIDRLFVQYTVGHFETTIGRQRINWGQTYVWNTNDIFNTYSYFDIDYIERPGSDAIRLKYYTGYTSSVELAAKIDSSDKVTAAGLVHFSLLGYDIQFLCGVLSEGDYLAGIGWSGNILNAGFRGEATYFHDIRSFRDTTGMIMLSTSLDYTFKNSLSLQGEFLYTNRPYVPAGGFLGYYTSPLNIKSLAFTEYSLFISLSYPFTPLFRGSFAGMYFPEMKGFFTGPSFTYNMMENIDLSLFLQYFSGEFENPLTSANTRENVMFSYLRLRWNF
jgi:hypothetical protein